ncbi:hypothetical protein [Salibacterium sp. K-3]
MKISKFLFTGVFFILSGTILLGLMHIAIAISITDIPGYSTPPGKFVTVLNSSIGWFPYVLSIVQIITGVILVYYDFDQKK